MARKARRTRRLRVVNPDCAGIDIGKDRHFVAVDPERSDEPVRSFGSFTRDLEAMESTSVYWIAVYETLERAGFEVMLVPPRMTKQIGGRKSDVLDCQWIWQLMSYGLLRGAFRPGDEVCPLRSYARQMRRLTEDRARCVLHMQKALTEMNVRLDSVIANIVGLTGQRILRAIVDGERDPERLAALRHRRVKADADTIAASLQWTRREEHLFALEQAMQRYDFLTRQIDDCEAQVMAEIERLTPPDDDPPDGGAPDPAPGTTSDTASSRSLNAASNDTGKEGIQALALRKMMGVDLTAIPTIGPGTALVIASELARISHEQGVHRGSEREKELLRQRSNQLQRRSPMPAECRPPAMQFARLDGRSVVADFGGGVMTSDAGALLLGATDRAIGLVDRFAACFSDGRAAGRVVHDVATLVGQRVFGIALGYEDLIDHDALRHDPVLGVVLGRLEARRAGCAPLAGKSTLNRLEHAPAGAHRYRRIGHEPDAIETLFVDLFLDAHGQ